ncbi:hypothetical protein RJ641_009280 [Dillenia turbinata]|uniref:Uncharacterized protein n=1 Tax=Dillenia turbinata TaxID=194707 RepID=A0AAN8V1S9_9MAGN
MQRSKKWEWLI